MEIFACIFILIWYHEAYEWIAFELLWPSNTAIFNLQILQIFSISFLQLKFSEYENIMFLHLMDVFNRRHCVDPGNASKLQLLIDADWQSEPPDFNEVSARSPSRLTWYLQYDGSSSNSRGVNIKRLNVFLSISSMQTENSIGRHAP